jgi:hypothetical protein
MPSVLCDSNFRLHYRKLLFQSQHICKEDNFRTYCDEAAIFKAVRVYQEFVTQVISQLPQCKESAFAKIQGQRYVGRVKEPKRNRNCHSQF